MTESVQEIEKKVIEVLAEKSCVDALKIKMETSLIDDLGMDSLDAMEAVFQFEEQYGIEIDDEKMRKFRKVKDVVDYINELLKRG
ncbi:acyl carrier protein [Thermodesulfobacteriota bacterium]